MTIECLIKQKRKQDLIKELLLIYGAKGNFRDVVIEFQNPVNRLANNPIPFPPVRGLNRVRK